MQKSLSTLALLTALLALSAPEGQALDTGVLVTRTAQKALGLDFTVNAEKQDEMVLVRMEIPRKGKLKEIYGVSLQLRTGKRVPLMVPVATRDEKGATVLGFQIGTEHARDCYINLITEDAPATCAAHYSVRLRDYVTVSRDCGHVTDE